MELCLVRIFLYSDWKLLGLNTKIYSVSLRIQSEYRKIRYRNNWTLYLDTFHAAVKAKCFNSFTINSRSKLEKLSTLFWGHLPRKIHYETEQGFKRQNRNIEKKKEKRRIRKSQTTTTNIFYFQLYRKNCTLIQNIFGKT